jgi:hypothetical protein
MYSLLGLRLERDVLATPGMVSFNIFRGCSLSSLSTFIGLYWGDIGLMPEAVAVAKSHHACGAFVVPSSKSSGPLTGIGPSQKHWWDVLHQQPLLELTVPGGLTIVVAGFNYLGKLKSKRRPERWLQIDHVERLESAPFRLGAVPASFTRHSPLASSNAPSPADDTCPATPPQSVPAGTRIPVSPASRWNQPLMAQWAEGYPDLRIKGIALEAVGPGVDPGFAGSMTKAVVRKNSRTIIGREPELHANLMKEVQLGRIAGPFRHCPFAYPRTIPLSMVKKDKHDPESTRMRIISNLSAGRAFRPRKIRPTDRIDAPAPRRGPSRSSSVNDLGGSPGVIEAHMHVGTLRDRIAIAGPGARAYATDVKDCFRNQLNLEALLQLFVYYIETLEHGLEWFVDLFNPFGWRPSEYGWACILAIFRWELRRRGFTKFDSFVDNFFRIFSSGENMVAEVSEFEAMATAAGCTLHEMQGPWEFKGLGWFWDLRSMQMQCLEDKRTAFQGYLRTWSGRIAQGTLTMSLREVRVGAGFMQWLSGGFTIGKADVASFICFRTALDRIQSSRGGTAEGIRGKAPPAVVASINFWNVEFPLWDGCCPIVAGFSPEFTWEALGRQDASTDWGCGGFLFSPGLLLGYAHPWSAPERRDAFVTERESTGVFELLGACHWMERFAHRVRGRRLQLELDNSSSVQGLARAYSDKPVLLTLIQRFRRKSAIYHITLRVFHVLECFNSIADHLSHGRIRDAQWLARRVFGIDMVMVR